jgi:hypothetical protein
MPTPDEVESAARAIDALLRGAMNGTIKKKEVTHLGPKVVEGIRMLEDGARKMRERGRAAE